jgi:dTMP kinase
MSGKLIVFEGCEGGGKTTQIHLLKEWLNQKGISVATTKEPGGTPLGQKLRHLILTPKQELITASVELLLYAADRAAHVEQVLRKELSAGKIVLCDRYVDSTVAYQGYGRGLDLNLISQLNQIATGGLQADLTFWLDVDVEVGLSRKRLNRDRLEQEDIAFHRRVHFGYAHIFAQDNKSHIRIDANNHPETVHKEIQKILLLKLQQWGYKQI